MNRIGLRAKVIVIVSLLVVAIIAINAAITMRAERLERERQLLEQGQLFARLTTTEVVRSYGSVSRGVGGRDIDEFNRRMDRLFKYYPDLVRLMILSGNGLVLYDSMESGPRPGSFRNVTDAALLERLKTTRMDVREGTGPQGEKVIDIITPVAEIDVPQFIKVRYIISYRSMDMRLADIRTDFILLAGFFILVGVVFAAVFSARLTGPILKLKDGAGEIASGNLDYTVEVSGADEIGELGNSFNMMARSLKEHRKSLEEANKNLISANNELTQLQKELIRSERMAAVGQMAVGLSHEIDNPIGVIMGFAELMLEDMPADDPRREDLVTIVEESKRCKRIVQGLLDFSRPTMMGVVQTDVGEVIRHTVDAAKSQRTFKGVDIRLSLDPDVPGIYANPDRLKQVFMNLLLNAAQAMPDGGRIDVALSCEAGGPGGARVVKAVFRDTGSGIHPDDIDKVFDPFFTTKRPGEGTGLGLAICVRLLEEQGGGIEVQSEPGAGSVFTVTLPVTSAPAAQDSESA